MFNTEKEAEFFIKQAGYLIEKGVKDLLVEDWANVYKLNLKNELYLKQNVKKNNVISASLDKVQQFMESHVHPDTDTGYKCFVEPKDGKYWIRGRHPVTREPIAWYKEGRIYMVKEWFNWFVSPVSADYWDKTKRLLHPKTYKLW